MSRASRGKWSQSLLWAVEAVTIVLSQTRVLTPTCKPKGETSSDAARTAPANNATVEKRKPCTGGSPVSREAKVRNRRFLS